jgi:predicted DNA-binding transcriptional regulator AlpA
MTDWRAEIIAHTDELTTGQLDALTQALPRFTVTTHDAETGTLTVGFVGPADSAWAALDDLRTAITDTAASAAIAITILTVTAYPAERSHLRLDLVGNAEIGAIYDKSRKWAWEVMSSSRAPEPVGATSSGPVYLRSDVEEYMRIRPGKPGRPRKGS